MTDGPGPRTVVLPSVLRFWPSSMDRDQRTVVLSKVCMSWPSFGSENGYVNYDRRTSSAAMFLPMVHPVPSSVSLENGFMDQDW